MIATVLSLVLVGGAASAQTPAPRPAQTPAAPAAPRQTPAPAPMVPAPAAVTPQAPAVAVPFPADAKIGFINMQLIVSQSKLGKAGQDRMKELNDRKSGELAAQNKSVQQLQQEIAAGQSVLSAAVLAQKNAELDRLTRETQFKQEQAQADVQALNDQLLEEFQAKALPIIEQVRAEKNLWAIFSTGDAGVAAMSAGLELSQEVIKRLDAAN